MARNCWAHREIMQVRNDDRKHEQKHCAWKPHMVCIMFGIPQPLLHTG
jgi:hypothetical protein